MVKKRACIFISGKGSNLNNLIKRSRDNSFPIKINLIISNKANAEGLNYAKKFSIPFIIIDTSKKNYEIKILNEISKRNISIICLAGYMKILSKRFIRQFKKPILNIHPSLLPKFKGINTYKRIIEKKERITGCTVHFVNEYLDSGKIILRKSFEIKASDNERNLKIKTQIMEHKSYPEAIIKVFKNINF